MRKRAILSALQSFAQSVKEKMSQAIAGEPEEQLRGPFENLISEVGKILNIKIVCTGETPLPGRLGRPDFAVHREGLLEVLSNSKHPE